MRKYLYLVFTFLFFVGGFAKNIVKDKFSDITITMKDGQVKSGKIKHPYNLNKKIVLILDSGEKVNVDTTLIDEVAVNHENAVTISFKNVYYYNHSGKKLNKEPKFMLVMLKDEALNLYYDNGVSYTNMMSSGLLVSTNYNNYYAIRQGEDGAKLISGYVNGQVNPNVLFRMLASKYFQDFPELSKKIDEKVYKYSDIITVITDYLNWKKSKK